MQPTRGARKRVRASGFGISFTFDWMTKWREFFSEDLVTKAKANANYFQHRLLAVCFTLEIRQGS